MAEEIIIGSLYVWSVDWIRDGVAFILIFLVIVMLEGLVDEEFKNVIDI